MMRFRQTISQHSIHTFLCLMILLSVANKSTFQVVAIRSDAACFATNSTE